MYFFNIKRKPVDIQLKKEKEPDFSHYKKISSVINESEKKCKNVLYFLPAALNGLNQHIGWGKDNFINRVEQGGILVGQVFNDEDKQKIIGIVKDIIPGESAPSNNISLNMTTEVWNSMYREFDLKDRNEELRIIGWYHTHPNTLDVFMSKVDVETQKRFFKHDWQFSVVFNPHRRVWKVFSGGKCMECQGYFLLDAELLKSNFVIGQNDSILIRGHNKSQYVLDSIHGNRYANVVFNSTLIDNREFHEAIMAENSNNNRITIIKKKYIKRIKESVFYNEYDNKSMNIGIVYNSLMKKVKENVNSLEILNFTPLKIIIDNQENDTSAVITNINNYGTSKNGVRVIAIFAAKLEMDICFFRRKYRDCQFLLWINKNDLEDVHFYDLL